MITRSTARLVLIAAAVVAAGVVAAAKGCRSTPTGDPSEAGFGAPSAAAGADDPRGADGASDGASDAGPVAPGEPAAAPSRAWRYTLRPSPDLSTLTATVCFDGEVPAFLDAQMPASRRSLIRAERTRGEQVWPLVQKREGIDLSPLEPGDCARHVLDLDATVRRAASDRGVRRLDGALLLSPDYWLWQPSGARSGLGGVEISAAFELPDGVGVAVPWPQPRPGDTYAIPPSAFTWKAHGALGRFSTRRVEVAGATLRISRLPARWRLDADALTAWLTGAARAVAQLYGRFPTDRAQIVVVPVAGDDIVFGYAGSGGGPSVVILAGAEAGARAVQDDWLAVHEMLHLGIPFMSDEDPWLYEGLVTYYEPVLRARAGQLTPREAWERLHDGFLRGSSRGSGRVLRAESARMSDTRQYWRVYWAGAAIALLADVQARASEPARSLDAEVRAMRDCCLDAPRKWKAAELLAEISASSAPGLSAEVPRLASVAARYLDTSEFPDYAAAYEALGLRFDDRGRVSASDDPDARQLRVAIMGGDVEPRRARR